MEKQRLMVLMAVLLLLVKAAFAGCSGDYIVNGGFEEPMVPLGVGIKYPAAEECYWESDSGVYSELLDDIQLGSMGYPLPPEGYQVMYWTDGKITQNTGITIESGRTYTVSMKLLTAVEPLLGQYVKAAFEDQDGNTIAESDSFLPSLSPLVWSDFSFTLNTAVYPDAVGKTLVVALDSFAYVYVDVVTLETGVVGDLNDNCSVDMEDLVIMADQWLENNRVELTVN